MVNLKLIAVFVLCMAAAGFIGMLFSIENLCPSCSSTTTTTISEDAWKIKELAHMVALHKRVDENLTYVCHHFAQDLVTLLHEYNYRAVYVVGRYDCSENYTSDLPPNHAWVWALDISQPIEAQSGEFLDGYNYAMCYHEYDDAIL